METKKISEMSDDELRKKASLFEKDLGSEEDSDDVCFRHRSYHIEMLRR